MRPELRETFNDIGLLFLRVAVGLMMIVGHGYPKLANFADRAMSFADPLGVGSQVSLSLAIFAEFFCAILVVVGLATRFAAVPVVFTMIVAGLIVNGDDPWSAQEKAIVFGVGFMTLVFTGAGRFSVDAVIGFLRRE